MTLKSSLLFAFRLIVPKTQKNSSARRSIIGAIVCIAISIVPLVVVLSVSAGLINGMTERIIGLSSSHLRSYMYRNSNYYTLDGIFEYGNILESVQGVVAARPEINCEALAISKDFRTGVQLRGVKTDIFEENPAFKNIFKTVDGNLDDFKNSNKAVIGEKAASLLGLKAGSKFRLIVSAKSGKLTVPKSVSYIVAAVVTSGYQELDALWVFVPIERLYKFAPAENSVFGFLIETDNPFSAKLENIRRQCSEKSSGIASVFRWDEVNVSQLQNFSSTKIMLMFIMMLIVIVSSVNVSSALVMLVMERRREIGILKSMGASSDGITFAFVITGIFCGLAGLVIGMPIGIFFALNINSIISSSEIFINFAVKFFYMAFSSNLENYTDIVLMDPAFYLTEIPIQLPFNELCVIGIAVIFLSFLVSLLPSIKAGEENPLEIFRKS